MIGSAPRIAARNVASINKQQKRRIVQWLTDYPDRVNEIKKIQNAGGTCQGEANPTWLKQDGDMLTAGVGLAIVGFGAVNCAVAHYRLATGTGKMD
mmetsp:Transcript_25510/g.24435  ORF Transcript_25510/g.24435 Transcript_25510/m.24435 type:complete len:96 (+) Transcript_25510:63-350(+)|eukprot:CAMPEP_0197823308 /NCGR_PEP_ID=MMETSP1437-20131217/639_1 /TAXON_ID=49252 ORGANISM="Eucampia antarctica, Strain CCMP1452" /NCGR_SAMPLE_ID=MMETSP1437 /ASSEMBLY_ACC=CAM_ASM_001096 /LENGTH=95 /DNA_ID=CAMNT_0043422403 /DNA_START=62 /DNA_END=349 /DNA_ORIENTATION=+